jgi:hypothetical protein
MIGASISAMITAAHAPAASEAAYIIEARAPHHEELRSLSRAEGAELAVAGGEVHALLGGNGGGHLTSVGRERRWPEQLPLRRVAKAE